MGGVGVGVKAHKSVRKNACWWYIIRSSGKIKIKKFAFHWLFPQLTPRNHFILWPMTRHPVESWFGLAIPIFFHPAMEICTHFCLFSFFSPLLHLKKTTTTKVNILRNYLFNMKWWPWLCKSKTVLFGNGTVKLLSKNLNHDKQTIKHSKVSDLYWNILHRNCTGEGFSTAR